MALPVEIVPFVNVPEGLLAKLALQIGWAVVGIHDISLTLRAEDVGFVGAFGLAQPLTAKTKKRAAEV